MAPYELADIVNAAQHRRLPSLDAATLDWTPKYDKKKDQSESAGTPSDPVPEHWRPIETAPKTKENVLVYCSDTGEQMVGSLREPERMGYMFAESPRATFVCYPTHWKPLPTPPGDTDE
jgi:hypothetical protein